MEPLRAQEIAERDQLWASLRVLRSDIDRLAAGEFDSSERQQMFVKLLASIVSAEMDYRARESNPD